MLTVSPQLSNVSVVQLKLHVHLAEARSNRFELQVRAWLENSASLGCDRYCLARPSSLSARRARFDGSNGENGPVGGLDGRFQKAGFVEKEWEKSMDYHPFFCQPHNHPTCFQ